MCHCHCHCHCLARDAHEYPSVSSIDVLYGDFPRLEFATCVPHMAFLILRVVSDLACTLLPLSSCERLTPMRPSINHDVHVWQVGLSVT